VATSSDPPSPAEAATSASSVALDGTWRATVADDDLRRTYPEPDHPDDGWASIEVPGHWRSNAAFATTDGPVLHRRRFDDPGTFGPGADHVDEADEPRRSWLVLDGVFYTSDVWLDGAYLGDTEGYFFGHSFEITDALAAQSEHVLALEVSCRPEADKAAKRNLTGVFQHWDLLDQDWNPGGIWRPVRIEQTGPVRIRHFRALCREANDATATVSLRAVLDTIASRTVELVTTIGGVEHRRSQPLASGENRVEWTITVASPELWWPHALGDPTLHDLRVEVRTDGDLLSDEQTRRIGLRSVELRDWIAHVNGERLFLKGSNQGPTKMALADATTEDLRRDIELAKAANLDFLRIHAHVSKPELYDAADEAGMLLWQDMPLQWGYQRSIRAQARRQARELVDLLAHHPIIFVWCGHNEPMAVDIEPAAMTDPRRRAGIVARAVAAQVLPTWNKSVLDRSIRRVLEATDGSRPVVPHSGVFPHPPLFDGTDTHTYFGWYYGDERDFGRAMRWWPRLARFVTEFGAQAVPADAGFLEPERWPDLDWERAYRNHALQKPFMDANVPPAAYASFDEWRAATQQHQATLIRHHVETLRRLKYSPCGGFAQFNFADGFPSVTWSVLGHDRQPKAGYAALTEVCAPVIVTTDPLPTVVAPGERIEADIHVVSDLRNALHDAVVSVHLLSGEDEIARGPSWAGAIPADSCERVGRLDLLAPARVATFTVEVRLHATDAASAGRPALVSAEPRRALAVRRHTVAVR
jgi:beta-mannosidase